MRGASHWRTVGPLPTWLQGLSGATLDNRVFMFGGVQSYQVEGTHLKDFILEFDRDMETWIQVAAMSEGRAFHAVSPIRYEFISRFCR